MFIQSIWSCESFAHWTTKAVTWTAFPIVGGVKQSFISKDDALAFYADNYSDRNGAVAGWSKEGSLIVQMMITAA